MTNVKRLIEYNILSVSNELKTISEEIKGRTTVVPVHTMAIINTFKPLTSLRFLALGKNGSTYNNVKIPSITMKKRVCIWKFKSEIKIGAIENIDKVIINLRLLLNLCCFCFIKCMYFTKL